MGLTDRLAAAQRARTDTHDSPQAEQSPTKASSTPAKKPRIARDRSTGPLTRFRRTPRRYDAGPSPVRHDGNGT